MVIKCLSDRHEHGQMVNEFDSQHRQGNGHQIHQLVEVGPNGHLILASNSNRLKQGQMVIEFVSQHRQGRMVIKFINW